MRRSFYVKEKDIAKYGDTVGCPGCIARALGGRVVAHGAECRARVEAAIVAEGDVDMRVEAAHARKREGNGQAVASTSSAAVAASSAAVAASTGAMRAAGVASVPTGADDVTIARAAVAIPTGGWRRLRRARRGGTLSSPLYGAGGAALSFLLCFFCANSAPFYFPVFLHGI